MDKTTIKVEEVEVEIGGFSTINFTDIPVNAPAPKPTCETCRFWVVERKVGVIEVGDCRRYPPQLSSAFFLAKGDDECPSSEADFPETLSTSWCGEYQGATA